MTLSILARCPASGQLGIATSGPLIAVGARAIACAAGAGVVLTQYMADPRLAQRGMSLLKSGCDAQHTVDALIASSSYAGWRQIAVLDAQGQAAAHNGGRVAPAVAAAIGADGCAVGSDLPQPGVASAMLSALQAHPHLELAERLLLALEEGLLAGGTVRPARSACLYVAAQHSFPLVDLRIDWSETPVADLRALWMRFAPWTHHFVLRATEPDIVRPAGNA